MSEQRKRKNQSIINGAGSTKKIAVTLNAISVYFDTFKAIDNITIAFNRHSVTAIIGPSGCGKSTLLRTINRMNDMIPSCAVEGEVHFEGRNIYDPSVDPVEIRRRIGMVFQKPNPFPKSIYNNIKWPAQINGLEVNYDELVERCLRRTALWDEVKDKLHQNALRLSGGQQQRLCIARSIAINPEIILMDEPASALDPISTARIEELIDELKKNYTIIIVTHNMQQAGRISDKTAFLTVNNEQAGKIVEYSNTREMFLNPKNKETEAYISGRFG